MKYPLFALDLPDTFSLNLEKHTSQRFESETASYEHQPPYITISLFPITHITAQKGEGLLEKYTKWSEGFKTELRSAEETQFKGYTTYIVKAKTDAIFLEQHFKIYYFNACILLDENWCIDFQGVYEMKDEATYQPLIDACFESIEILGNAETWSEAFYEEVEATQKAYQEELAARAAEELEQKYEAPPFEIPPDGQEYIRIGQLEFEFVEEDCKWNTVQFSERLYIQIKAKTSQIQLGKEQGILEYGYELEEGEIKLSFDCTEIFQQGIPTGEFLFEEGKTGAPHFIHFRNSGIGLDFYGRASLQQGYVGIIGIFRKSYQDEPFFPVSICKKIATEEIDWSLYQFTHQEALQAKPETVRYLWVKECKQAELPEQVLSFPQLRKLRIQSGRHTADSGTQALKIIPQAIGDLTHLTELNICNTSVEVLPESLGNLKNLERLNLMSNQLSFLPKSIFSLPKLNYLWAGGNHLLEIPQDIDLPELQQADFSKNKLTTLPESLASQAKLKKLRLDRNPWETLPEAYNQVEDIELDINDKRRLLSYAYEGADGKGILGWQNEVFFAKHDPRLQAYLNKAVEGNVLSKYKVALEKLALKTVCINTTEADDYGSRGNTRFGGLPDLPKGEAYPHWYSDYHKEDYHYIFIAQLNCAELAPYQDYLPRKGILYFYLEDEESFGCKVMYHPNPEDLQAASDIDQEELNIFDMDEPYAPFKAIFSPFVGLPSFYSDDYWYDLVKAPELQNLEDYDHPDYEAFEESDRDNFRKALGKKGRFQAWNNTYYPDSHHSINDYVFTQHESPQEQAALKFKGNPEDWVVLLKVYSDNNCGFCFWDAGELFFVIHKNDLAKGDFSRVYAGIETS